jgi:hypothetical protein
MADITAVTLAHSGTSSTRLPLMPKTLEELRLTFFSFSNLLLDITMAECLPALCMLHLYVQLRTGMYVDFSAAPATADVFSRMSSVVVPALETLHIHNVFNAQWLQLSSLGNMLESRTMRRLKTLTIDVHSRARQHVDFDAIRSTCEQYRVNVVFSKD